MSDGVFSCRQIVELVTEYLDASLPAAERVAFERHVAICPPCRGYFAQLRVVTRVAGRLGAEDLSPGMREGLAGAFADWKSTRREG